MAAGAELVGRRATVRREIRAGDLGVHALRNASRVRKHERAVAVGPGLAGLGSVRKGVVAVGAAEAAGSAVTHEP